MNSALYAVTNRISFVSPVFPTVPTYVPIVLDPIPASVHSLLQLDYNTTDYYIVGVLAALRTFPELLECLGADDATYNLTDYNRPLDTFAPNLVPDANGPSWVRRVPIEFPVGFQIQLFYENPITASVLCGSLSANIVVAVDNVNQVLLPQWPTWTGVSGGIDISQEAWQPGFQAVINHVPISYPYDAASAALTNSRAANTLLLQTGLMAHYFHAKSGVERVATIAAALALSNPSFSWPLFPYTNQQ